MRFAIAPIEDEGAKWPLELKASDLSFKAIVLPLDDLESREREIYSGAATIICPKVFFECMQIDIELRGFFVVEVLFASIDLRHPRSSYQRMLLIL